MEDKIKSYDIPDFGPDDDTEDMAGVLIYKPNREDKDAIPDLKDFPKDSSIKEESN